MRKIIMILVMAMVAFGSFAKSFKYEAGDDKWEYFEKERILTREYKWPQGDEYWINVFDVSEEDAWKIINGEDFPTFEFDRNEYDLSGEHHVCIHRMPCRDYRNRK
jgi:hypothetical protein